VAPESATERTRGRYVHCDYMGWESRTC
jgi:hypothetical protein